MGGKGSGRKPFNMYMFPSDTKRPQVTWKGKDLHAFTKSEMIAAKRYLVEGWNSGLPEGMLCTYTGLSMEQIEELKARDKQLAEFERDHEDRLKTIARVNIAKSIEDGNIRDSRWLLEHLDNEFKPQSKLDGNMMQIVVPVEEKQEEFAKLLERLAPVELGDESTNGTAGE